MIEKKYVEMMNAELDGVNSKEESAELHEYLATNREANTYYEDLKAVFHSIDSGGREVEPPADLEGRILSSIPKGRYPSAPQGRRITTWVEKWFGAPRWGYAVAFAAGILIGVTLYSRIGYDGSSGGSVDNSHLYGTMIQIEASDGFKQLQSVGVDLAGVRGQVSLHESGGALLAEVSLWSSDVIEWVLELDGDQTVFEGFRHVDGQDCDIVAAGSETRIRQAGDNKYIFFFDQKGYSETPMVLKIYSADHSLLFEKPLSTAAAD